MTISDGKAAIALHDNRIEQCLLACLLRDGQQLDDVSPPLTADDFYAHAHQRIFATLVSMRSRGAPLDLVGVASELQRLKQIDDVGGWEYLALVYEADTVGADAVRWAGIVREYAQLRRLRQAGCDIAAAVDHRHGGASELIEKAQRDLFQLGCETATAGETPLGEVLAEVMLRLDRQDDDGIPSGIVPLDRMTGGFRPGELFIVAARPSVGKTAVALTIAGHVVAHVGKSVLYASLEMGKVELGQRLLTSWAGVNGQTIRQTGVWTNEQAERVVEAKQILAAAPLFILDEPGITVSRLAAVCRRRKARHGLGLVLVDYLGLLEPEDRRQPRHEQVAVMSRRLKLLARELSIPVVALSQLNRESEARAGQQPRLSDLRDSGAVEQDADAVLLLSRVEGMPGELRLDLAKQRNGPVGEFTVHFDRSTQRITANVSNYSRSVFPD